MVKKRNMFDIAGVYKKDNAADGESGQGKKLNILLPLLKHFFDLYKPVVCRDCCKNNIFFHTVFPFGADRKNRYFERKIKNTFDNNHTFI